MHALPLTGGGFDQRFPQSPQSVASHGLYGAISDLSEALLRWFLSTPAGRHLLMHMAGSEHLQDKMMELGSLKKQAGQVAGAWG